MSGSYGAVQFVTVVLVSLAVLVVVIVVVGLVVRVLLVLVVFIVLVVMPQIAMLELQNFLVVEGVHNQNLNLFKSVKKWRGMALILVPKQKRHEGGNRKKIHAVGKRPRPFPSYVIHEVAGSCRNFQ